MSLTRAEARRLGKRRFVRLLVIGALAVLAAVAIGVFLSNQKVGLTQVAEAKAAADRDYQEAVRYAEQERQRCLTAPGTADAPNYPADCSTMYQPSPADYPADWHLPSTFVFQRDFGNMLTTFAAIFALLGFVVGASFVGAEWSSGGMMNLLLWRPRRLQVLGTKLGVLIAAVGALSMLTAVGWTLWFLMVAKTRGSTDGMTAGAWRSVALTEVRAILLILVATAIGFGLASLGRHTAVALGVAVGVVIVFQFGLYVVLSMARVAYAEIVLLPIWVIAWMDKKLELENPNSCNFSAVSGCVAEKLTLTWPMAGGLLAAIVALVIGSAMWTMRSRDIA